MRRSLPGVPRRRRTSRALVLLPLALFAPAVNTAANTTALSSRSIPCGPASTSNAANTLTSQSCSDACGPSTSHSLCVYRTHAPSSCAVDCVPTEAADTTWTAKWLEDQPNGRAAVVVTSAASNGEAESTVVIHDSVTRIADQLTLPTSIMQVSLTGPTTSPLMKFSLSDGMRTSFASLRYLALNKVSVSDWKTLPTMPTLRNLSLNDVALDWWPNTTSFDVLEALSLDNNPLPASIPTLPATLRTLSLQSTGITELPLSLSNLTMLRNLFLGGNKIPKIGTVNFPKSLQTLSMRDCVLDSFPGNVELLPGLVALDLSNNPGIQSFTNSTALSGLRELRLAGCGIKTFSAIPSLNRELSILDLSSNPLTDTDDTVSAQLSSLPNLLSLDLSATDRRHVADAIATMTRLRHLSLASNKILTIGAASLPSSLQHLNLAYNDRAMSLSVPPALLSLNVSNCGLASLTPVVPLAKLESLDASGNSLESNDLPPHVLPRTLTFLNLSNNRLTTFPTAVFALPSLQHLDLRGNPIPPGAVASLSAAHAAFLNGLESLYVDRSVFQSSDCGASVASFSFGYTVCILASSATDKRTNDPAAEAAAARARARVNRNLAVIAITIGTALVLVTLTSLVMRRRSRARAHAASKRGGLLLAGTAAQTDGAWPTELASDREMTDAEWRALQMWSFWDDEDVLQLRVPWDLVRDRQVIGSGQYSVLWLARVATQPVFLKALQPTAHRSDDLHDEGAVAAVAALMREIQVLRFVRHPQIVRLVGVTWLNSPTDVQLAIEDMANGDLRGYLELTQPPAPPSRWRSDGLAMRVALAIAEALVFLHACGVAHNDLRSRNVVLDDDCHAKLTGFGRHVFVAPVEDEDDEQEHTLFVDAVARAVATAAQRDQHAPPPRVDHTFLLEAGRWMAPEVLRRHLRGRQRSLRSASSTSTTTTTTATAAASPAADVYAFGVLLLELDAFEMPFERVEVDGDMHDWRPRDDSTSDDDDGWEKQPPAHDVAPLAASDLRFSSMPSGHNSLLGGGATLLLHEPTMPSTPPPKFTGDAARGGATLLHAAEEKCELALLRRLADGAVQAEPTPSCPAGVRDLVRQCLAMRPESRPSMKVVRDALRAIASQRHRSSTGGSSANVNSTSTTVDSSHRGGGRGGQVAAAAQTGDEDRAGVAGSSSADSDATTTTAFFVMHHTPTHRSVTPPT